MAEIVISEFMDQTSVDTLKSEFEVVYDPDLVDKPEELEDQLKSARALIVRNRTQVCGRLIDVASNLEVVGRLGVGLDNIDLETCRQRSIAVCPATGANDQSVAEYVITTAMVLLRGAYYASSGIIQGNWPRQACIGREIAGKRLGLIGFGNIARETAARARALGMAVAAHDPFVPEDDPAWRDTDRLDLSAILGSSDVISLHVPLTDGTHGLIGAEALSSLKPDAVLINTARGGVVDEGALVSALKTGKLGGAALDVFESEPVKDSGAIFESTPNLILTPHIGGVTEESNVRVSRVTADNVGRVLRENRSAPSRND